MSKFVVSIFEDEAKAYEGVRALQELHREGSVTMYGVAVVEREENGALTRKVQADEGPIGTGVGMLLGGMIGLFGGPIGAAAGMATGGLAGGWRDFLQAEVNEEFLEAVGAELSPGKFAVIAEVAEAWDVALDSRIAALGGTVVREQREEFIEDLIEKRVDARKAAFEQWKNDRATAKAEKMEEKLEERINDARDKLQRTAEKAKTRLEQTKEEMEEKLKALEEQTRMAKPEAKEKIEHRIAEIREQFGQRERKLEHAYELAQEALRA
jgi:uncharacterized membrane protein